MTPQSEQPWIEWYGGESPVSFVTRVQIRLRNGRGTSNMVAKGWHEAGQVDWRHYNDSRRNTDIIAYRIIQP